MPDPEFVRVARLSALRAIDHDGIVYGLGKRRGRDARRAERAVERSVPFASRLDRRGLASDRPTVRSSEGSMRRLHRAGLDRALAVRPGGGLAPARRRDADDDETPTTTPPAPQGARRVASSRSATTRRSSATSTRSTKGAEKIDGLFTLHRKDEHLYAEIKPNQFDQPFLAPITIARGMAMAGQPAELRRRVGPRLPAGRRQGPAHPPEHPLQGPVGLAAGEGGQAELHRLDPDGPADRQRSTTSAARAS